MKYCWTTLRVSDFERSIKFYSEIIGLKIQREISHGDLNICFLGEGETQIELIYDNEFNESCTGEGISMGFEVESLDKFTEFLKDIQIEVKSGPFSPNPNTSFLYILDPSGYKVQIVENKQ